ncbi:MAG: phosphatidylglycerophosphatase A [Planctomycetota bacterium]|nr:phosphatidylglycerophosphatase A [Planctomycetota bacterium]
MRKFILSFFAIGFLPRLPGTLTSATTAAAVYFFQILFPSPHIQVAFLISSSLLLFFLFRKEDGKDPTWVTLDEVAGQSLSLIKLHNTTLSFTSCAIGFLLFRFFDILKPTPIRQLQRLKGALGVLADDIAAGVFSSSLLNLISILILPTAT